MSVLQYKQTAEIHRQESVAQKDALKSIFTQAIASIMLWRKRSLEREQLNNMSPKMLDDIGLSRIDAMNEASKPFWKA